MIVLYVFCLFHSAWRRPSPFSLLNIESAVTLRKDSFDTSNCRPGVHGQLGGADWAGVECHRSPGHHRLEPGLRGRHVPPPQGDVDIDIRKFIEGAARFFNVKAPVSIFIKEKAVVS